MFIVLTDEEPVGPAGSVNFVEILEGGVCICHVINKEKHESPS